MYWCSLFRTIILLQLLSGTKLHRGSKSDWNPRREAMNTFMETVGLQKSCGTTPPPSKERQKPTCVEKIGCDIPLNCFNYSLLTKDKLAKATKVTPHELEHILENPAVTNTCAVVMFYAPWCPYSVDFAQRFNALGRTYRELPVLAVEFSESDMYKYLTAYVPLVTFYYRGRVVYRFRATESYEELVEQISIMTGFVPTRVELTDGHNEDPVPTVREDGDALYLFLATAWVTLVGLVYLCTTKPVKDWLFRITSRFRRTKTD